MITLYERLNLLMRVKFQLTMMIGLHEGLSAYDGRVLINKDDWFVYRV